jgi:hypothetical protein
MYKIYVAHPYGGKEENKIAVEEIVKELVANNPDILYMSPIHAFGYLYDTVSYEKGMEYCIDLLRGCDELLLCEGWENSKGCCAEYTYALGKGIPVKYHNEIGMTIKLVESEVRKQYPMSLEMFDFNKKYVVEEYHKQGSISIKVYDKDNRVHFYMLNKEHYIRVGNQKEVDSINKVKGIPMTVPIYEGTDMARGLYDFIVKKQKSGEIVELPGVIDKVRIIDAVITQVDDIDLFVTRYKIEAIVVIV